MSVHAHSRSSFRFQGRSFMAFVLAPVAPLSDWLKGLEIWISKSPDFFSSKPLILDLSGISLERAEFNEFLALMRVRKFRIISVEGINPDWLEPELEPLSGGKNSKEFERVEKEPERVSSQTLQEKPEANSLLLNMPVRSGSSVYFPTGDVTIAGSVASGAEVISGGSVHIYGALRGRIFAGCAGNADARIFCRQFEAELLVIGGYYKSSEDIDPDLFGRPVQAMLKGSEIELKVME